MFIDEYKKERNFNFDAESKPKQFFVKIINVRKKQGIFSTIPFINVNSSSQLLSELQDHVTISKEDNITDCLRIPRDVLMG